MSSPRTIGLLHPGEMGASVGAAARAAGHRVLWTSPGRSPATAARAVAAGLEDAGDLGDLVGRSDLVFSVCPPHAALDVAQTVAVAGFRGIYVEANAISPEHARQAAALVEAAGAAFVDGGITGQPVGSGGATRLYLSGNRAADAAACFAGSDLEAVVIGDRPGAASALKMAYAAQTKGSTALLAAILALAQYHGVADALRQEWDRSHRGLDAQARQRLERAAPKAWRWTGEMDEIAATFCAAGLPGGFHEAAGEVYRRLAGFADAESAAATELIDSLLAETAKAAP
jgi:3-hydroxyisobutyrate dehydrogenase-like beta-hydroxyacid dehydrogenase